MSEGRKASTWSAVEPGRLATDRTGGNGNGRARKAPDLALAEVGEGAIPGAGLVRRAGTYLLGVAGVVVASAAVAALLVEADVAVKTTGVLEPLDVWAAHAPVGGVVAEVLVAAGDTVEAGEALVVLDGSEVEARRRDLEVERAAAEVALAEARATLDREARARSARLAAAEASVAETEAELRVQMALYGFGLNVDSMVAAHRMGAHATMDERVAAVRRARAEAARETGPPEGGPPVEALVVERRRLELERATLALVTLDRDAGRLVVRAPAGGVVLTDGVERLVGSYVEAGRRVLELGGREGWRATLAVGEADVHRVAVGDEARLEVEALEEVLGAPLRGRVAFVAPDGAGAGDGGGAAGAPPLAAGPAIPARAAAYRVVVAVDRDALAGLDADALRRGYTVRARIVSDRGTVAALVWRALGRERERPTGSGS